MKNLFLKILERVRERQIRFRCHLYGHLWEQGEVKVDNLLGLTMIAYECDRCRATVLVTETVRETIARQELVARNWGSNVVSRASGSPRPPKFLSEGNT